MSKEEAALFEIHVTVSTDRPTDLYDFRMWCNLKKYKPIHAVSRTMPPQLMMSKYKNGTMEECVTHAKHIAEDLRSRGLVPTRTKVEAMMNGWSGVPKDPDPSQKGKYFEWHLKYEPEHAAYLETVVSGKTDVFVSYNQLKKEMVPLLTIRVPGEVGMTEAVKRKDAWIARIKEGGVHTHEGIAAEYAVYDDNTTLDSY